jgi:hypothetical protein
VVKQELQIVTPVGPSMPIFYFHIRQDGELIEDPDGTELAGIEEARAAAKEDARALIADRIRTGRVVEPNAIEIIDQHGASLAVVTFRDVVEELTPHFKRDAS